MADTEKRRQTVFQEIYEVDKLSDILELFEIDYNSIKNKSLKDINELYKKYSYAIFFMYETSSIRNNLVKFKKVIAKNGGKYEANAKEVFTIDNVYVPIKKNDEAKKRNQKEKIQSGENTKIDPNIVIEKIQLLKKELENKSYLPIGRNQKEQQVRAYRIVAMLGLATGRRFTELMKTLVIRKRGSKVTFDGLLKGNNEAIVGHIIGLSYKEVQTFLKELRAYAKTKDMSPSDVNRKFARVFNNALFGLGFKNVKSTRHNYSIAGSQIFKEEGESIEDTITRILGHKEVFTSALNYT